MNNKTTESFKQSEIKTIENLENLDHQAESTIHPDECWRTVLNKLKIPYQEYSKHIEEIIDYNANKLPLLAELFDPLDWIFAEDMQRILKKTSKLRQEVLSVINERGINQPMNYR